jgi:hypothetical protein
MCLQQLVLQAATTFVTAGAFVAVSIALVALLLLLL